ncbi:hypothetical protein MJ1HA_0595 [Metallosphaera sedula]|nr:hypothetical protein MJ1HA_0595 [Metallosphaera sedula]
MAFAVLNELRSISFFLRNCVRSGTFRILHILDNLSCHLVLKYKRLVNRHDENLLARSASAVTPTFRASSSTVNLELWLG